MGGAKLVTSRKRVGIAVSVEFLELDAGWPQLRAALVARRLEPVILVWDDDHGSDSEPVDLVVVNYCWGYVTRRAEFLVWARRTADRAPLVNPLPALVWNSDKVYLENLAAVGVPTVPTRFVPPGHQWVAPAGEFVVKPSVASGGWGAARYSPGATEAAAAHIASLHEHGQTAMIQPYQPSVDTVGETAMVFFAGRYSHAVRKASILRTDAGVTDRLWELETVSPTAASEAQLTLMFHADGP